MNRTQSETASKKCSRSMLVATECFESSSSLGNVCVLTQASSTEEINLHIKFGLRFCEGIYMSGQVKVDVYMKFALHLHGECRCVRMQLRNVYVFVCE